jgi:hypothetical protein
MSLVFSIFKIRVKSIQGSFNLMFLLEISERFRQKLAWRQKCISDERSQWNPKVTLWTACYILNPSKSLSTCRKELVWIPSKGFWKRVYKFRIRKWNWRWRGWSFLKGRKNQQKGSSEVGFSLRKDPRRVILDYCGFLFIARLYHNEFEERRIVQQEVAILLNTVIQ